MTFTKVSDSLTVFCLSVDIAVVVESLGRRFKVASDLCQTATGKSVHIIITEDFCILLNC